VEVCILGGLVAIGMTIFRMPYTPLISVLIALTAFIPTVGAWVGSIVGAFLILLKSPMLAIAFVVMFLVLQLIENNMIYPRVVGNSVGLSGMWVLVAVAIGGDLMGIIGMFLMIPVVSVLYTLLQEITNKKLSNSTVDASKLQPQPPELVSKYKEKRETRKMKNLLRKQKKSENKE
jgi:predicted PurR-regulated permease PerM